MADEMMEDYEGAAPTNDVYTFLVLIALVLMLAGIFLVYKEIDSTYSKDIKLGPIPGATASSAAAGGAASGGK
ncbi:MAG: hypothetical protein HYZ53_10860 [Planctomycetes bacterium]|nr:hypothetical protein [Planctomycetota bacterium]